MIVLSEKLPPGVAFAGEQAASSVLAFYIAIVYLVGKLLRATCGGTRYQLGLDQLPDVTSLLEVIEAIHLARSTGRLKRETQLHEMLLRLYRSPAVLLQITGERLKSVREHAQVRSPRAQRRGVPGQGRPSTA